MKRVFQPPILLLLISVMLITSNIYGQTRLEIVELSTQKSIRKLTIKINKLDDKDAILINNLKLLSNSATTLFQKIRNDQNIGQQNDTVFITTLEHSQQALNQLIVDWSSDEDAANLMKAIKIDYDTKINASPLGASSKVITNIEVSVVTKSAGQDAAGYDVFYTYMWDSVAKKEKNPFVNQTNNAIKKLAPGYYFFWIEKNGVTIQNKPKVEIGNLLLPKEFIIFNL